MKNENIRKEKSLSHETFPASDNETAVRNNGPSLVSDEVGDLMRCAIYVCAVEHTMSTAVATQRPSSTTAVVLFMTRAKACALSMHHVAGAHRFTEVNDAMSSVCGRRMWIALKADQPTPTIRDAATAEDAHIRNGVDVLRAEVMRVRIKRSNVHLGDVEALMTSACPGMSDG